MLGKKKEYAQSHKKLVEEEYKFQILAPHYLILLCVGYNAIFGNRLYVNIEERVLLTIHSFLWIHFHCFFLIESSPFNLLRPEFMHRDS